MTLFSHSHGVDHSGVSHFVFYLESSLVKTQRREYVVHWDDAINDLDELSDTELEHAEEDCGLERVVSPHFAEDFATNLETFKDSVVDFGLFALNSSRFIINKLDEEATVSIVVKLKVAVLEYFAIVALCIRTFYDVIALHMNEFDRAGYSTLWVSYFASAFTCVGKQLLADLVCFFLDPFLFSSCSRYIIWGGFVSPPLFRFFLAPFER